MLVNLFDKFQNTKDDFTITVLKMDLPMGKIQVQAAGPDQKPPYEGWQPYCLKCSTMRRMTRLADGFRCEACQNEIGNNLLRKKPQTISLEGLEEDIKSGVYRHVTDGQEMINYEERYAGKKVYFQVYPDVDYAVALVDCDIVQPVGLLQVRMSAAQAKELLSPRSQRRAIQDIMPQHHQAVREVFLSGLTPLEWEVRIKNIQPPKAGTKKCKEYFEDAIANYGYVFDDL